MSPKSFARFQNRLLRRSRLQSQALGRGRQTLREHGPGRRQVVVRLLVDMLAPYKSHIYNPYCCSGGMFMQSEKFVEAYGGNLAYG